MTCDGTCPDSSLPPPLVLRRLLDLCCFYARSAADERDGLRTQLQLQLQEAQNMRSDKSALARVREQLEASEAQVQQLQATVADVTSASALESRVLLQKIAQLSEGPQRQQSNEQQLQV
jgi:hypothetical protein